MVPKSRKCSVYRRGFFEKRFTEKRVYITCGGSLIHFSGGGGGELLIYFGRLKCREIFPLRPAPNNL